MEIQETFAQDPSSVKIESVERPPHLDVGELAKKYDTYFVHTIQTGTWNPVENNKTLDTSQLTLEDRLDIIYALNPTLSTSSVRPNKEDGTFHGVWGVVFSGGEVVSASGQDKGTIAKSFSERFAYGELLNKEEDIENAVNRPDIKPNGEVRQKSYNEVVLKEPKPAGAFLKMSTFKDRISVQQAVSRYGEDLVAQDIQVLDLENEFEVVGKTRTLKEDYDKTMEYFKTCKEKGDVFMFDDEKNLMYFVTKFDEESRKIYFQTKPVTPSEMANPTGPFTEGVNKYLQKEMKERLVKKGILAEEV